MAAYDLGDRIIDLQVLPGILASYCRMAEAVLLKKRDFGPRFMPVIEIKVMKQRAS